MSVRVKYFTNIHFCQRRISESKMVDREGLKENTGYPVDAHSHRHCQCYHHRHCIRKFPKRKNVKRIQPFIYPDTIQKGWHATNVHTLVLFKRYDTKVKRWNNHQTSLREIPETVWHKSGVPLPPKSEIPRAHKSSGFQQKSLGRCSCSWRSVALLNIPISVTAKSFCNRSPQGNMSQNLRKIRKPID